MAAALLQKPRDMWCNFPPSGLITRTLFTYPSLTSPTPWDLPQRPEENLQPILVALLQYPPCLNLYLFSQCFSYEKICSGPGTEQGIVCIIAVAFCRLMVSHFCLLLCVNVKQLPYWLYIYFDPEDVTNHSHNSLQVKSSWLLSILILVIGLKRMLKKKKKTCNSINSCMFRLTFWPTWSSNLKIQS